MAYDEELARRVRTVLEEKPIDERKMFGGLCFLYRSHMCCGIVGHELMVRVGPEAYESALAKPHARPMDFTGRPMRGLVYVGAKGIKTEQQLRKWVERGLAYASSLPPKKPKASKKPPSRLSRR